MLEFDGAIKYHRFRRPGESLEEMVMREKGREDLLRELTGWTMIRITWADLARPAEPAARIRRAIQMPACLPPSMKTRCSLPALTPMKRMVASVCSAVVTM